MAQLSWNSSSSGSWSTAADWSGGSVPGAADDVTIAVAGITVTVNGIFAVDSITTSLSVLSVTGGSLAVGNYLLLDGNYQQTGGSVSVAGDATMNGAYLQSGGTMLLAYRGGVFNGGVTLTGGVLNDEGQEFVSNGNYTQSAGTLVISGIGGVFNENLTETAGLIDLKSGTIGLAGAVTTLDGTVTGNGTLVVEGAQNGLNGTTTIEKSTVLSVGKLSLESGVLALAHAAAAYTFTYGGYFLTSNQGTVELGGNTLVLSGGAELADQISGAGTVNVKNGAQLDGLLLNNSAVLDISTAATLVPLQNGPGQVTLENSSSIVIGTGDSLRVTGNDLINDADNNSSLLDNGTLVRGSGAGTAEILPSFTEAASASVSIALGALDFSGVSDSFSGTISGAGTFSLGAFNTQQPTSFTFGSGIALNVANFVLTAQNANEQDVLTITNNLTYAGNWDQSGGLFELGYEGQSPAPVLTLTGSVILDGGVIKSSTGSIATTGLVSLSSNQQYSQGVDIEGFTQFSVAGTARQDASIQFGAQSGSKPTATILGTGTWLLQDAASITGAYGTVINDGTLEKNIGSGVSSIDGTLVNNGLFDIAASQVLLDGSGTLGGTITGLGQLDFEGNGAYELTSAVDLTVSHVLIDNTPFGANSSVVSLGGNLSYGGIWAQHGGTVDLNGGTLTLDGSTSVLDGGTLNGPGTLLANGPLTIGGSLNSTFTIGSSAVLDLTKSAEQSGGITVSNLADLNISATSTYTLDDTVSILGGGTLSVAGSMVTEGTGYSEIQPATDLTGKITAMAGTLAFVGSVSGTGSLIFHSGAEIDLDNAVSSGVTITMAGGHAALLIADAPAYEGLISDFVSTDTIEIEQLASGSIHTSLSANGKLLTISDSANHTYTLGFAQAQTASSLLVSDGNNGLIGIYHT